MNDELEFLAQLVRRRADSIDVSFRALRAKDYPTDHLRKLVEFPSSVVAHVRAGVDKGLAQASVPGANDRLKSAVANRLKRYGRALQFVSHSLAFVEGADALSVPSGFVYYLAEQSTRLMPDAQLALRGDPEFNYGFLPIGTAINKSLSRDVKPRLSERFGLFQIPSALQDDALQHCILGHELGHFLDTSMNLLDQVWKGAPGGVRARATRLLTTEGGVMRGGADLEVQTEYFNQFGAWTQEVICDLVGCRLLGPAFFYAGREFSAFNAEPWKGSTWHPPTRLRHWINVGELTQLGWDRSVTKYGQPLPRIAVPGVITPALIKAASGRDRRELVVAKCLLLLLPSIRRTIRNIVRANRLTASTFDRTGQQLRDRLSHMLPIGEIAWSGKDRFIEASLILVAGWLFHVDGYPGWPDPIGHGGRDANIEKRRLLNRLVVKSVEISYVGRHWERG